MADKMDLVLEQLKILTGEINAIKATMATKEDVVKVQDGVDHLSVELSIVKADVSEVKFEQRAIREESNDNFKKLYDITDNHQKQLNSLNQRVHHVEAKV